MHIRVIFAVTLEYDLSASELDHCKANAIDRVKSRIKKLTSAPGEGFVILAADRVNPFDAFVKPKDKINLAGEER